MTIQSLSLKITDKISRRNIANKFLKLDEFYLKSQEERENIIEKKLSLTLKNAYESIPFYYDLAEKNRLKDIFLIAQLIS